MERGIAYESIFFDFQKRERRPCVFIGVVCPSERVVIAPLIQANAAYHDRNGMPTTTKDVGDRKVECRLETDMLDPDTQNAWVRRVYFCIIDCPFEEFEYYVIDVATNLQVECRRKLLFFPFITSPVPSDEDLVRVAAQLHDSSLQLEPLICFPDDPEEQMGLVNDAVEKAAFLFLQEQDKIYQRELRRGQAKKTCVVV